MAMGKKGTRVMYTPTEELIKQLDERYGNPYATDCALIQQGIALLREQDERIKELEKYGKHKLHAQMGDADHRPRKEGNADLYRGTRNFLRRCRESLYQSFQRRRLGSEQNFVDCKR